MKKQRQLFIEQEEFRRWKRKLSIANLLQEPVAQEAIGDLWTDLFQKGPEWREIYSNMHNFEPSTEVELQSSPTIAPKNASDVVDI